MTAILHATPGSILNQFATRRADVFPYLAFPFYHSMGGKVWTFAGDGETALIWTRRRLPGYRDWLPDSGPDDFSPALWVDRALGGSSHPLVQPSWERIEAVRMVVSGHPAFLPHRTALALSAFDTCYVGLSRLKPAISGHPVPAVSVHWTLGSMAGGGLVICEDAPSLAKPQP